jgi:hypothetical protein
MNPDFEQKYLPGVAVTVTYVTLRLAVGLWLLVFGY